MSYPVPDNYTRRMPADMTAPIRHSRTSANAPARVAIFVMNRVRCVNQPVFGGHSIRLPLARTGHTGHRRGESVVAAKGIPMKVRVHVSLKNGVLDPQGRAIHHAIEGLGFSGVSDVRAGRLFELEVDDSVSDAALEDMAGKLLANMVIENYRIERVAG